MKPMKKFGSVLGLAAVLALGACADMNAPPNAYGSEPAYPQSSNTGGVYSAYGVVQSIELVRQNNTGIGIGAIAGAVVGGIVGNQVGAGQGKTAATVVGAAGGAYAGHQVEKRNQQQADAYKFTIRMRDGSYQTVMQTTNPDIRVGDRVQIDNGVARRY
ncbi:glycine zipper 2TM domain-containing protein [Rhodoferax ferrireducens]|uniref:glycine zipper 2TM domain-containing protein n=1 Tax=Rhodoferax ferrireducens TaxID=192843 RepID=UPI000E0D3A6C|nr:glycine zipper 2TM domain-containing protein [Rhodoferax ferrireducens]